MLAKLRSGSFLKTELSKAKASFSKSKQVVKARKSSLLPMQETAQTPKHTLVGDEGQMKQLMKSKVYKLKTAAVKLFMPCDDHPATDNVKIVRQVPDAIDRDCMLRFLFAEDEKSKRGLEVSDRLLDFLSVDAKGGSVQTRDLFVANKFDDKALRVIAVLKDSAFEVTPTTMTLKPGQQKAMQVSFAPKQESHFYFAQLHLSACSSMLFELKTDPSSTSPRAQHVLPSVQDQSLNASVFIAEEKVTLSGNTFLSCQQPFIPMLDFDPKAQVLFRPCRLNEEIFQLLTITNSTDTPAFFKVHRIDPPFAVLPPSGLVARKSFTNLLLRFKPTKHLGAEGKLVLKVNINYKKAIKLVGYCSESQLDIENGGQVFFPPCFIGVTQDRQISMKNKGRDPLRVTLKVPKSYRSEVRLNPLTFSL